MKLTFAQIDRAISALQYFSARQKEVKIDDKVTLVPNPCYFGDKHWDFAENESMLRARWDAHQAARKALLAKHQIKGMKPSEPTGEYLNDSNVLEDTAYEVDIIMIPEADLKQDENKIPVSFLSYIAFMVDRGKRRKIAAAAA